MIRESNIFLVAIIVLLASCEKEPHINFGFDSMIDNNSNGLVIAHISKNIERIYLNGTITLSVGRVVIYLTNPDGVAEYSRTIIAPAEIRIYETFYTNPGYWKLEYKSNEGVGEINLHIFK